MHVSMHMLGLRGRLPETRSSAVISPYRLSDEAILWEPRTPRVEDWAEGLGIALTARESSSLTVLASLSSRMALLSARERSQGHPLSTRSRADSGAIMLERTTAEKETRTVVLSPSRRPSMAKAPPSPSPPRAHKRVEGVRSVPGSTFGSRKCSPTPRSDGQESGTTSNPKLKSLELRMSVPFRTGTTKIAAPWLGVGPGCSRTIGRLGCINQPMYINQNGIPSRFNVWLAQVFADAAFWRARK